jgi:hypothetical protein
VALGGDHESGITGEQTARHVPLEGVQERVGGLVDLDKVLAGSDLAPEDVLAARTFLEIIAGTSVSVGRGPVDGGPRGASPGSSVIAGAFSACKKMTRVQARPGRATSERPANRLGAAGKYG